MGDRSVDSGTTLRPAVDVVTWRRTRLVRAGFDPHHAAELSCDPAMDLHALLDLVAGGCPPHLAVRIVAPLETPGGLRRP